MGGKLMIDAFLSLAAALAASIYLTEWAAGDTPDALGTAAWSLALAIYAYTVHRTKRRISQQHFRDLLKTLREEL